MIHQQQFLRRKNHQLVIRWRGHSELCALLVHPFHGLRNVGRCQADVLETRTSVTVQEVLHVGVGILLERFGQHQLEVQTEIKTISMLMLIFSKQEH